MDLQKDTFSRSIEIECRDVCLDIYQRIVGDVGCVVWDAGLSLAKFLDYKTMKSKTFLQDVSVLELGAGTGIVGLVAAVCGANVELTDLPDNVPLLQLNISENSSKLSGRATAYALTWGKTDLQSIHKPDIILVSDCVYYNESINPLVQTMVQLSFPETTVYVAYEDRDLGNKKEMQSDFLRISENYFDIQEVPESEFHPGFFSSDIHILKMNKRS